MLKVLVHLPCITQSGATPQLGIIVTKHLNDVFRQVFINFSMSRDGLRYFGSWILIPIMVATVADKDAAHILKFLY
jgi:hypothetical protein